MHSNQTSEGRWADATGQIYKWEDYKRSDKGAVSCFFARMGNRAAWVDKVDWCATLNGSHWLFSILASDVGVLWEQQITSAVDLCSVLDAELTARGCLLHRQDKWRPLLTVNHHRCHAASPFCTKKLYLLKCNNYWGINYERECQMVSL